MRSPLIRHLLDAIALILSADSRHVLREVFVKDRLSFEIESGRRPQTTCAAI